jgi:hypothetical protein
MMVTIERVEIKKNGTVCAYLSNGSEHQTMVGHFTEEEFKTRTLELEKLLRPEDF